jgi:membrane-associated phospholipid phosphatase
LGAGAKNLFNLSAEVPHSAIYGKAGVLDITDVKINNGAISALGDQAVELAAYFGEATGNQRYSALDGQRILRVVVGLDSGFAAYPTTDPVIVADITGNGLLSSLDGTRVLQEVVGLDRAEIQPITPVILAGLTHDNGVSATDHLTNDPTVSGTVSDDGSVTGFQVSLNGGSFVNAFSDLNNGSFSFSKTRFEQLFGAPLADGSHVLHLQATDNQGNLSTIADLKFTLDTQVPTITSFNLSLGSDTGAPGDNITSAVIVSLTGASEAGAMLNLGTTDVLVGGGGIFQIPNVTLNPGPNTITITSNDAAGNSDQKSLTVTRQGQVTADVALQWNQLALEAIRLTVTDPPIASRALAMVSIAQYDTLAAIEGTPAYLIHQNVSGPVSLDVALAKAAHTVLFALFPSLRANFDTALNQLLSSITDGAGKTNALNLGLSIGSAILAIRANDGSSNFVEYDGSTAIGLWRPTAPMFEVADEPQWGDVTPFALTSPDEFRPVAPPALESAAYAASVEETKSLGSAASTTRTADQTQIAQFWADGKGSYTPSGHWNVIAQTVALSQGNSLSANVRLFAQLNVAFVDSSIAAWDAKYTYGLWRPIDAIHNADQDNNPATIQDANWTPLLITPFHPEFVSGHSTYSAAAATILANIFGDNTQFNATAFTLPGITRNFSSFMQAAQEAGRSRIYGGIHYEFTNQAGQALGQQVASAVLARFALNQDNQAPSVIADSTAITTNTNVTITGQILDNISGVQTAQYQIDQNPLQNLAFDSQGKFGITTTFNLTGTDDGQHTLTVFAQDAAGNQTAAFSKTIILDTTAPTIDLTSIANNATIDETTSLTGAADPTGSTLIVLNYKFDNGTVRSIIFDNTTGQFDDLIELRDLTAGTHTLTLTAKDASGNQTTLTRNVTLAALAPLTVTEVTPAPGSSDVGSTFRPQVFFSRAVNPTTLTNNSFYATDTTGAKLAATIVVGDGGHFAWLFFTNPMPGASTITVHLNGDVIQAAGDAQLLDADGDGTPGGVGTYSFSTVSLASIPNTTIFGRVLDPGPDLEPMTFDDIGRGPDGVIHTPDDVYKLPLVHVQVSILGRPDLTTFTDANGFFQLTNTPAGNIKLAVDGRTATNVPAGVFFPEMVLDLTIEPGLPNTAMGSMGSPEEQRTNETREEIYLPRLQQSILRTTSNTQETKISVDSNFTPDLTSDQAEMLYLMVPPNTAVGSNGQAIQNVQIGISTVPPELIRDMLPQGVMQLSNTITIQARGPNGEVVDRFVNPIQLTFPNVYGAAPGTKLAFYSFDHTTGRLVIEGTATVSADGLSATTDPGQGITKPGWHGFIALVCKFLASIEDDLDALPGPCRDALKQLFELGGNIAIVSLLTLLATTSAPLAAQVTAFVTLTGLSTILWEEGLNAIDHIRNGTPINNIAVANTIVTTTQPILDVIPIARLKNQSFQALSKRFLDKGLSFLFTDNSLALRTRILGGLSAGLQILGSGLSGYLVGKLIQDCLNSLNLSDSLRNTTESTFESQFLNYVESNMEGSPEFDRNLTLLSSFYERLSSAESNFVDSYLALFGAKILEKLDGVTFDEAYLAFSDDKITITNADRTTLKDPITGKPLELNVQDVVAPGLISEVNITKLQAFAVASLQLADAYNEIAAQLEQILESAKTILRSLGEFFDHVLKPGESGGEVFYRVSDVFSGAELLRGSVRAENGLDLALPSSRSLLIQAVNSKTLAIGEIAFRTGTGGSITQLSEILPPGVNRLRVFPRERGVDQDNDGLSDFVEIVLGTSSVKADTDGDGLSDAAEIRQGLDPLGGRPAATGVLASLPLQGQAKEVVLEGSTQSSETQIAYVATGSYGLAIVDASQFQKPIILSQLDLPGEAVDIAVDSRLQIAAVAGTTGLHFIDVFNPMAPQLLKTVNIPATQVELVDGVVYAAVGNGIELYTAATGELLQILSLGGGTITGLVREGSTLYTMDSAHTLRAIDISGLSMVARGSLSLAVGGGKIFAGNGIAYVGTTDSINQGFSTVNLADPNNLTLISGVDAGNIIGGSIAVNGSGRAVTVGTILTANSLDSALDVVNVADPADTGNFITRFKLAAAPFSVAIGAGIAFVADGSGGLQVVNYQSFDNKGIPPTATITLPSNVDRDLNTPGIQVQEGSLIPITVNTNDDVQVRNVELLVNGAVVRNDVSFPWDLSAALPNLAAGSTTATIQVRATDTGGNTTLSNAITVDLVPDTFAPTIAQSNVADGSRHAQNFRTVRLRFSEAMDEATLTADNLFVLDSAGNVIRPIDVGISSDGATVNLTFATFATGTYRLSIGGDNVKDRAGNAFGSGSVIVSTFEISQATIEWINNAGGSWNTLANWDLGRVPNATDVVLINAGLGPVTLNGATIRIQGLETFNAINFGGGSLQITGEMTTHASLILAGVLSVGNLTLGAGTTLQLQSSGRVTGGVITGPGTLSVFASGREVGILDGVRVEAPVSFGSSLDGAIGTTLRLTGAVVLANQMQIGDAGTLDIQGGLTLEGSTITLNDNVSGGEFTQILFSGTNQVLTGSGEVVFAGNGSQNWVRTTQGALIIDSGVTIRTTTGSGLVGDDSLVQATNGSVINRGRISADGPGKSITVQGTSVTNEAGGTIEVKNGGALVVTNLIQRGTLSSTAGSRLQLSGTAKFETDTVLGTGTVELSGAIDNTGHTLTLGATPGDLRMLGATIKGGTLNLGEPLLVDTGRLEGVTVNGDLDLRPLSTNAVLRIKDVALNGTVHLGQGSSLAFEGTQTFPSGTIEFDTLVSGGGQMVEMQTAGTLTLGSGVVLCGGFGAVGGNRFFGQAMTLVNQGTISSDIGRSLTVSAASFTNQGIVEANNGATLSVSNFQPNLGIINAKVGGLINITGNFTNTSTGIINEFIGGTATSQFGRVSISGAATLGGTLNVSLANGFTPSNGQTFAILTYGSHGATTFSTINGLTIGGGLVFNPQYNATNLTLAVAAGGSQSLAAAEQTALTSPLDVPPSSAATSTDLLSPNSLGGVCYASEEEQLNPSRFIESSVLDDVLSKRLSKNTGKSWLFFTRR